MVGRRSKGETGMSSYPPDRSSGVSGGYKSAPKQLAPQNWELSNQVDTEILIEKEQNIQELRETVEVIK